MIYNVVQHHSASSTVNTIINSIAGAHQLMAVVPLYRLVSLPSSPSSHRSLGLSRVRQRLQSLRNSYLSRLLRFSDYLVILL